MSQSIWPFNLNDKVYNKPAINGSKCTVNNIDFIQSVMECPKLFKHIMDNKQQIDSSLSHYIESISEPFIPALPFGTLGRLRNAQSEWQDLEKHKYVRLDLIHCADFNNRILSFHDEEAQYGFFFINIIKSMQTKKIELYFDRETKPADDEEHIWCNYDDIEPIYIPQAGDDIKDERIGFLMLLNQFLTNEHNDKADELIELEDETNIVLLSRLRSKIRNGKKGQIKSVQGIIQKSLWDSAEGKLEDILQSDDDYSTNSNITSYKLSRNKLFTQMHINPIFLIKVFDENGKEMKLIRNVKNATLYIENSSYTQAVKHLVLQIAKKYSKSNRIAQSINGFNGLRMSYNTSTRALIFKTNNFQSSVTVDIERNKVDIFGTSGRNGGW